MAHARRRALELVTAAAVAVFGSVVAAESLSHDIGWGPQGPGAGYFPFRTGLLLIAAGVLLAIRAARDRADHVVVTDAGFLQSVSVFWPTAALAVAMFPLGAYLPGVIYLSWMMRAHGRYGWGRALATSVVVMVIVFAVFELGFQVPLPKGLLEQAIGVD